MKYILILLLSFPTLGLASEWTYSLGSKELLKKALEKNLGESELFNCEILIEKNDNGIESDYFITVFDYFTGGSAVLNMKFNNKLSSSGHGKINIYRETEETFVKSLSLFINLNNEITEISIVEVNFYDMNYINNVKCSKNGRIF